MKLFQQISHGFLIVCLLIPTFVFGQKLDKYRLIPSEKGVLVKKNDSSLLGFIGGMKSPLMANLDINNDGIKDLIIHDQVEHFTQVVLIKKVEGKVIYLPGNQWVDVLPKLNGFFAIMDLDKDGIEDIITGFNTLTFYKGLGYDNGYPEYEKRKEKLEFTDREAVNELKFNFGDAPTFADIDGDGDLDLLAFDDQGSFVRYYQNQMEEKDSLYFILKSACWGSFQEASTNNAISLGVSCQNRIMNKTKKHLGAKLTALDYDGDGDIDLLISDVNSENITFLTNGMVEFSYPIDTMIAQTTEWPNNQNPVVINSFPIVSLVDVDANETKDVVATSTSRTPEAPNVIWLYINSETNRFDLAFSHKSFLIDQVIDKGRDAVPAIADVDGDGLEDIVLAGAHHINFNTNLGFEMSLSLYKNKNGVYELIDDDYLNFRGKGVPFISPCFGDINNDGKIDLIIGKINGKIDVYLNKSNPNEAISYDNVITDYQNISVYQEARPCVYDVNADGKNDLVIGNSFGELSCFLNKNDAFELYSEKWGGIKSTATFWDYTFHDGKIVDSTLDQLANGIAHPTIADVDNDGQMDLLVGSSWGELYFYPKIAFDDSYFIRVKNFYHNPILNEQFNKNNGTNVHPVFADFNGDNQLDVFVGTASGGIVIMEGAQVPVGIEKNIHKTIDLDVFPNPSQGMVWLKNNSSESQHISLYTLDGKLLQQFELKANSSTSMECKTKGLLLLKAQTKQSIIYKRVVFY